MNCNCQLREYIAGRDFHYVTIWQQPQCRLISAILAIGVMCCFAVVEASDPTSSEYVPHGYRLVWNDEFQGTDLNEQWWFYRCEGLSSDGTGVSTLSRDAVTVDGAGLLVLSTLERDGSLLTGMIGTDRKLEFKYGYFESRIQFQRQQGHHGAFWIKSREYNNFPGNPARAGVEIDVAEFFGSGRKDRGFAVNVYWNGSDGKTNKVPAKADLSAILSNNGKELCDDFHVFSVEWTPKQYVFRVDGHVVFTTDQSVSHTEQPVIFSLLSNAWEEPRLDRRRLDDAMRVDYVRVYQSISSPKRLLGTE